MSASCFFKQNHRSIRDIELYLLLDEQFEVAKIQAVFTFAASTRILQVPHTWSHCANSFMTTN